MVALVDVDTFSRIDKLFVDQKEMAPEDSFAKRAAYRIDVICGHEVGTCRTAQAAAMTALRIAERCYPGGVGLHASEAVRAKLFGNGSTASRQYARLSTSPDYVIVVGTADPVDHCLQVSFDGWTAQVGPGQGERLAERDHCPLAGVLAGALAVSETFMDFAGIDVAATRRRIQMSLWEPGVKSPDVGPKLTYLPTRAWLAGLGHLGQAYAWAYSWLPVSARARPELWLVDDERIGDSNLETGVLNLRADLGDYKARMASAWLAQRGVETRMIERRIDASFRVANGEPMLILGGFDSNPARHVLANAGATLVDAGIGDRADNFDTIVIRTWPNPRSAEDLWPSHASRNDLASRLARDNPAYTALTNDICGRVQLAERAVGVPFVGMAAAAFAWAQVLRDLHGGRHLTDLKIKLSSPGEMEAFSRPSTAEDIEHIEYVDNSALS